MLNANMKSPKVNDRHEMYIRTSLLECVQLLRLISQNLYNTEGHYFFSLFSVYFRQLAYYFFDKSSPFISYKERFTSSEQDNLSKMIDIRNVSGHLNSELGWLNDNIMLHNSFSFSDNDVEIQFGKMKILLLKEIIPLYEKVRTVLAEIPELSRTSKHPMWRIEEQTILVIKKELLRNLANSSKELRKKRPSLLSLHEPQD